MQEFQQEWNNSICTLVAKRATRPPKFDYDPHFHDGLSMAMSDASDLYVPKPASRNANRRNIAVIKVTDNKNRGSGNSVAKERRTLQLPTGDGKPKPNDTKINSVGVPVATPSTTSPSAVGKPDIGNSISQPVQSTPQPKLEMPAKKEGTEVSVSDIIVSTTSTPKATNDTTVSTASTTQSSQASRHQASNNIGATLPQAGLAIEPLVLPNPSGTSDAQTSATEKQESGSKATPLESLLPSAAVQPKTNHDIETNMRVLQ